MAGPFFKIGDLNIETTKTSSDSKIELELEVVEATRDSNESKIEVVEATGDSNEPEIEAVEVTGDSNEPEIEAVEATGDSNEPEIEAIEATGDSNEVCGLERKDCDEIMEHLKNNPGLVVKSLGSEGQTVLHIAVVESETKKPKPPTSKCIDKGLRDAPNDDDWYMALVMKDCQTLMDLLQENSYLLVQTGPEGKTVLHTAAQKGCSKLLHQVFNLFKKPETRIDGKSDEFVDEEVGVGVDLVDLLRAKYGPSEAEFQNMAWFTFSRQAYNFTHPHTFTSLTSGTQFRSSSSSPDAPQRVKDKLFEIMQGESAVEAFVDLEEDYDCDVNYNFELEQKELFKFHFACRNFDLPIGTEKFVKTIIDQCLELGPPESVEVLTYLCQLCNAQGKPPIYLVSKCEGIKTFLKFLPTDPAYKKCLNTRDVRGWTILHYSTAIKNYHILEVLLEDERVDVNARTSIPDGDHKESGMTALHLAILHDDVRSVKLLLECSRTNVNALLYRWIVCGYERMRPDDDSNKLEEKMYWTPLQLAAIMGLSDVVEALLESLEVCDIYYDEKLQNGVGENFRNVSPLLLACALGNPDTLRLFLDSQKFDPLVKSKEGATALHYASNAMISRIEEREEEFRHYKVGRFLYFSNLGKLDRDISCRYEEEPKVIKLTPTSYLGKEACITMLLQAGVDIWEKDNRHRLADPGPQAPKEALLWWHEQMARETLEAKKSLNDATNAISVVVALVATTSFVGPLQPPLGYGGDSVDGGVQDNYLSIRVFMVSNILSFYSAVASIMFAVVPSLPMPQEGIYAEWQHTRRSVGVAIFFLLMSVLGVLISFGTASNSVMSEDYSWQHAGLSFYPTLLGGLICILGIILFFIRLLRLVFNRNAKIRSLYKTFVKF